MIEFVQELVRPEAEVPQDAPRARSTRLAAPRGSCPASPRRPLDGAKASASSLRSPCHPAQDTPWQRLMPSATGHRAFPTTVLQGGDPNTSSSPRAGRRRAARGSSASASGWCIARVLDTPAMRPICDELPGLRESQVVAPVLESGEERADRILAICSMGPFGVDVTAKRTIRSKLGAGLEAVRLPSDEARLDDLGEDRLLTSPLLSEAVQMVVPSAQRSCGIVRHRRRRAATLPGRTSSRRPGMSILAVGAPGRALDRWWHARTAIARSRLAGVPEFGSGIGRPAP